jgi:hypothetical protein
MKKNFTLFSVMLCGMLSVCSSSFATSKTRMEVAVERHQQQAQYVPVNNLWETDPGFSSASVTAHVKKSQGVVANTTVQNALLTQKPAGIVLAVPTADGRVYELELMSFDFFSDAFKVATNANGVVSDFAYNKGVYYRGVVKNVPGSIASFSIFADEMYGVFSIPNVGDFVVAPNTLQTPRVKDHYVVFNDQDAVEARPSDGCGTDFLPKMPKSTKEGAKNVYNTCKDVEEFIKVDYDTYLDYGGNAAAVTAVTNYMTALYNMIATLYRNEGVYTSIRRIEVNTTVDVYSGISTKSSHNYLYQMDDEFNGNLYGADLCMLVTNINSGMGGVAWLNALCATATPGTNYGPYSFSNIRSNFNTNLTILPSYHWDIEVITHEMGHNLGSPHTHSCVWGPNNDQAIDWCGPTYDSDLEDCSTPVPNPTGTVGGTIMSYCHLLGSVGIKFANGFGPEPGQVVRDFVDNSSCATAYVVTAPLATADDTLVANRECTDGNITYYFQDNNDARESNDKIVLAIRKNGNDIGDLNDAPAQFNVETITGVDYNTGKAQTIPMPAGVAGIDKALASYRYWKMRVTQQPTTDVELLYNFLRTDVNDLDAATTKSINVLDVNMYMATSGAVNVDPAMGLASAAATDLKFYSPGTASTTTQYLLASNADTFTAVMMTNKLYGGAMYVVESFPTSVMEVGTDNISFYPNPTTNDWSVYIPLTSGNTTVSLFAADGRLVKKQALEAGKVNKVGSAMLAPGMYFYRVNSDVTTYTGTLKKQ